jgi:pimeloyl-ACP methyl ester carboxylesterase
MSLCASNQMLLEGAHVAGHSLGGVVALQLALETPERVHSLVLPEAGILDVIGPVYRCCLTIVATRQEQKPAEAARRATGSTRLVCALLRTHLAHHGTRPPGRERCALPTERGQAVRQRVGHHRVHDDHGCA